MENLIFPKLQALLGRRLGLSPAEIRQDSRLGELPGWDSIMHFAVLLDVEREFGVRIPALELAELDSVENIQSFLNRIHSPIP